MTKNNNTEIELNELLDEDVDQVIQRELTSFDQLIKPFGNRLVLFGAGNLGCKTLLGLRQVGIEPLAFADNNPKLWDSYVNGLQVLSPFDAARKFGQNSTFIITIWRANGGDRMIMRRKQLSDLNCVNIISFGSLFWKYPLFFLPHACLDLPSRILQHKRDLKTLYYLWADEDSRREYLAQLRFRLRMDFDSLPPPVAHKQYFPDDLFTILPDDVFVDCGAFDGDTIQEFLRHQNDFSGRVFAYEPDQINFQKLMEYILTLPEPIRTKVTAKQVAVGASNQKVHFSSTGTVSSRVIEDGELEINSISIDQEMSNNKPTFVKMDIEGAEIDALIGAQQTIHQNRPILAICVYHKPSHLWGIPLFISSFTDDYRSYLRPHDLEGWDLVLYSIPAERCSIARDD